MFVRRPFRGFNQLPMVAAAAQQRSTVACSRRWPRWHGSRGTDTD